MPFRTFGSRACQLTESAFGSKLIGNKIGGLEILGIFDLEYFPCLSTKVLNFRLCLFSSLEQLYHKINVKHLTLHACVSISPRFVDSRIQIKAASPQKRPGPFNYQAGRNKEAPRYTSERAKFLLVLSVSWRKPLGYRCVGESFQGSIEFSSTRIDQNKAFKLPNRKKWFLAEAPFLS